MNRYNRLNSTCKTAAVNGHRILALEQVLDLRRGESHLAEEGSAADIGDERLAKVR